MADKAIRKISLNKIKVVESHAEMLYNAVQNNKAEMPKNNLYLTKNIYFQEAVSALILELIDAIKGEKEDNTNGNN